MIAPGSSANSIKGFIYLNVFGGVGSWVMFRISMSEGKLYGFIGKATVRLLGGAGGGSLYGT